jgi:hypothetical protein
MATPEELDARYTLRTAAARHEDLRLADVLAPSPDEPTLSRDEALELLALSEVIARKATYGRQLTVRTARATGATWEQIGAALGVDRAAAQALHIRWLDEQAGRG